MKGIKESKERKVGKKYMQERKIGRREGWQEGRKEKYKRKLGKVKQGRNEK